MSIGNFWVWVFVWLGVASAQTPEGNVQTTPSSLEAERATIDNPRLSAQAGARKKIFVAADLIYVGGSLQKPFSEERPNYRRLSQNVNEVASLEGLLRLSYRLSPEAFWYGAVGVMIMTPFHNSLSWWARNYRPYQGTSQRIVTFDGVMLGYRKTFQRGHFIQMWDFLTDFPTDSFSWDIVGTLTSLEASYTVLISTVSGWQFGLAAGLTQVFYRDPAVGDKQGRPRIDRGIGFFPFVEFNRDRLGWRILYGVQHFVLRGSSDWYRPEPYMSTGINISLREDVWLYPNVQWVPADARPERTNTGLSIVYNF